MTEDGFAQLVMSLIQQETLAGTPTNVALTRFLRYAARFSEHTQRRYRDTLYRFLPFLPVHVENIKAEHIDIFVNSLKMLNSSKNSHLVPVRSFLRWCEDYLDIPNVAKKVKPLPQEPPKQRVITEIEYSKLLEVAKPHEKAVLQVLANTGLRSSEFCSLTAQNVSPDQKSLSITGKGRKRRTVPLNEIARQALISNLSKSYTKDQLIYLCLSLAKRCEIPKFSPHSMRHFFCTRMVKTGVPLALVSKCLGHKNVAITAIIYCHILDSDTLGVTDCLDF